jgi:hypothetical protein
VILKSDNLPFKMLSATFAVGIRISVSLSDLIAVFCCNYSVEMSLLEVLPTTYLVSLTELSSPSSTKPRDFLVTYPCLSKPRSTGSTKLSSVMFTALLLLKPYRSLPS